MSVSKLPAGDPKQLGLSVQALQRLEAAIGEGIERRRFPGAVSLIARRGELAWFNVQGKLDPQSDEAMPGDAIFRIYSMTKPIVSVAIMMLVEEGKLLLADPLEKYIPEFAKPKVAIESAVGLDYVASGRSIMVHDLLRHTSGLAYDFVATGAVQKLYAEAGLRRRNRTNENFCEKDD